MSEALSQDERSFMDEVITYPFLHPIKTVKAVGWVVLAANAAVLAKSAGQFGAEIFRDGVRNWRNSDDS